MGVWDLMGLFQEIKKWEKLLKQKGVQSANRDFYLLQLKEAKSAYQREIMNWELRVKARKRNDYGQHSE